MEKQEKEKKEGGEGKIDFSNPEDCIKFLQDCLSDKEELLNQDTSQKHYLFINWTTKVSLCAQSMRSEM